VSTLLIIILVLIVLVIALAIGGAIATQRRTQAQSGALRDQLRLADEALAQAHAEDNGWDRVTMEQAAVTAFEVRHGDASIHELQLVQVVDRPGTAEDEAIFRVRTDSGEHELKLGRRDGTWVVA
jgi:type II secretory pathway pseudopilin PulG